MKLTLVSIHIEPSARAMPLGPAMLAAMLDRELGKRVETSVLNCFLQQDAAECVAQILATSPDAVGLSVYTWNHLLALEVAARLKRERPDLTVFAGGPEPTTNSVERLAAEIDFLLPGEAEWRIVEVVRALSEGRELTDEMLSGGARHVSDLSSLASPFLSRRLRLEEYSGVLWELSRGCPYRCDFCYESRGVAGVRRFPLERVQQELTLFGECGVDQVFVLDPTFNCDRENAKQILRMIAELAPETHFCFEARTEFLDEEMAGLFAAISCTLQFGMQSASDDVLRNVNRRIDRDAFEQQILLLHQAGVAYGFDLIYGLPGDSLAGFMSSLDFAMGLVPNHVDIFPLAVLPGTRLQETAQGFGLEYAQGAPYVVEATPTFSHKKMGKAARIAAAVDWFYNRGMAVPWFGIVAGALGMKASEFFRVFASSVDFTGVEEDEERVALQQSFVSGLLREGGKAQLVPVAEDVINYFGRFERFCAEGESVAFSHDPYELIDLLESGVTDLKALHKQLAPCPWRAFVADQDGALTVVLEKG